MRTITIAFLIPWLLPIVGCQPKKVFTDEAIWRAAEGGLAVEARAARHRYVRGQTLTLTVAARNTTDSDMIIKANSGALIYARLWRQTVIGWEEVKRYPQTAVVVASPWKLSAGQEYKCALNLPVEADWPTGEPLKLTVELNGRPDVVPGGYIRVFATQADYDEAMKD